jgi:hypothetical protein
MAPPWLKPSNRMRDVSMQRLSCTCFRISSTSVVSAVASQSPLVASGAMKMVLPFARAKSPK